MWLALARQFVTENCNPRRNLTHVELNSSKAFSAVHFPPFSDNPSQCNYVDFNTFGVASQTLANWKKVFLIASLIARRTSVCPLLFCRRRRMIIYSIVSIRSACRCQTIIAFCRNRNKCLRLLEQKFVPSQKATKRATFSNYSNS